MKFFVIADPNSSNLEIVLHNIYELYADYVLKVIMEFCWFHQNPFYEVDQPIKCEQFDVQLEQKLGWSL